MALIPLNTFKTKTRIIPSYTTTTATVTAYVAPIGVTSIILMAQVANISTQTQTVSFIHYILSSYEFAVSNMLNVSWHVPVVLAYT